MAIQASQYQGRCVHANGIDIHYVEAGEGEPLLLLDNAMVSTNPIWASVPFAYASVMAMLAERFRVIAPDTRGSGKSIHPGGPIPSALLADDVAALIDALTLDRPLICGFSDGGETATLVGIRNHGSVRAIVNHGGYDLFNPDPQAPAIASRRSSSPATGIRSAPSRKGRPPTARYRPANSRCCRTPATWSPAPPCRP